MKQSKDAFDFPVAAAAVVSRSKEANNNKITVRVLVARSMTAYTH